MNKEGNTWSGRSKRFVAGTSIVAASVLGVASLGALAQTPGPSTTAPAATDDTATTVPADGSTTTPPDDGLTEGGESSGSDSSSSGQTNLSGDRITGLSQDLSLESARVESVDLDDTASEYVVFEFGSFVRGIGNEKGFELAGPSVTSTVSSQSARLVQGSPSEVLVEFPSGTDVESFSIARVGADVVEDEAGQGNVPATASLGGSTLQGGRSAGPDLVSVSVNDTLDRATYRFDENLDESATPNPKAFGLYTFDGFVLEAARVISVEDQEVVVEFDDQVEDGVRLFAEGAVVKDRQGVASVPGSIGADTTSPDLLSVSRVDGDTQFDFRFSEDVVNIKAGSFAVYDDAGKRYEGKDWARIDAETVRVIFPEIDDFTDDIVVAAVDRGAAEANDGSGAAATVGSVAVNGSGIGVGVTSGPDLVSVSVDQTSGQVRFVFDEAVDDDAAYDAKKFFVVTRAGDLVAGRSFVEADDNWVLITFDKNIVEAADGFVITDGAAKDFAGNNSPAGSL